MCIQENQEDTFATQNENIYFGFTKQFYQSILWGWMFERRI